jgi:hypothetical protein
MSTVQAQHPAVVLRSSYLHLRALLVIAGIAIAGLTVAVVVLALNTSTGASANVAPNSNPPAISNYPGHF